MEQGQTEQSQPEGSDIAKQASETFVALAEKGAPLEFGSVELDAEGKVTERDTSKPLSIRFHFHGVPFDVQVQGGEESRIGISSDLGQLPFTAESPLGRRAAQRIIRAASELPRGRLFLDERDHIRLEASTERPQGATRVQVFAAISALVLDFLPFLRLLTQALPRQAYRESLS